MASDDNLFWHYTSLEACLSILEHQQIRMTLADFLNDTSEMKHFIEHTLDRYSQSQDQVKKKASSQLESLLLGASPIAVFSLSSKNDDIYQWTAYTPIKGGVAIGFDIQIEYDDPNLGCVSADFLPISAGEFMLVKSEGCEAQVFFRKCEYGEHRRTDLLVDDLYKKLEPLDSIVSDFFHEFTFPMIGHAIKHKGFEVEQEWRLLADVRDNKKKYFDTKKPYVLAKFDRSIVKKIMIAPHGDKEQVLATLRHFCDTYDVKIEFETSTIPLRR